MKFRKRSHITSLLFLLATAAPTFAAPDETVVHLTISPAAQPDPALKYTLIPQPVDQIPGPAAPVYYNAMFVLSEYVNYQDKQRHLADVVDAALDTPISSLKPGDFSTVTNQPGAIDLLTQASLRDHADWSNTVRQQGFEALLPNLSHFRSVASFLSLRARVQLAQHDLPGCLQSTRLLFSLANHLREDSVLVQSLVGTAIADQGLNHILQDYVQTPDAPNLYWALAALPKPFFDMQEAMSWEKVAIRSSIAPLRNGRSPDLLGPCEWEQVTRDFLRFSSGGSSNPSQQVNTTVMAIVLFPKSKQQLLDHGYTPESLNSMPAPQIIGMALLQNFDHWSDEAAKCSALPFYQAFPLLHQLNEHLNAVKALDPVNPVYAIFPAFDRAYLSLAKLDRHIALIQTVEALRNYAAAHSTTLPSSLDELTETPAPLDPLTGKSFDYHQTSDTTAELSSIGAPLEADTNQTAVRYIITLRK
ncbi:MAG TPA: hypothetical protein VFE58_19965 [Tepidisphaeraceae bacterium]|jgi:hypothetical protein|nr:hypothetical protein [Tepidisphaeraceae bacterium]